jgi:hypothetical protein
MRKNLLYCYECLSSKLYRNGQDHGILVVDIIISIIIGLLLKIVI